MKKIFSVQVLAAVLLALAAESPVRAADTNLPPATTNSLTHKPSLEERRTRMEIWRAKHRGTTNVVATNTPPEDTKKLSIPERSARIRAKLAEARQTNSQSTNSTAIKP